MSLISDLIAHLVANTTVFNTIEHAWSMQPFDKPSDNSPALFLCPGNEQSSPSGYDNHVIQNTSVSLHLFFVVDHSLLETARNEVFTAILGWQYNSQYEALEHTSGITKDIKGNYIWWIDEFETSIHRRQQ